jgi:hypothetical protein
VETERSEGEGWASWKRWSEAEEGEGVTAFLSHSGPVFGVRARQEMEGMLRTLGCEPQSHPPSFLPSSSSCEESRTCRQNEWFIATLSHMVDEMDKKDEMRARKVD